MVDGFLEEGPLYPGVPGNSNFSLMKPIMSHCNSLCDVARKMGSGSSIILVRGENFSDTCQKLNWLMEAFVQAEQSEEAREELFSKVDSSFRPLMEALSAYFSKEKVAFPTVVICAGGGVSCPADSALLRRLGCDAVYISNEIFQKEDAGSLGDHLYATIEAVKCSESLDRLNKCTADRLNRELARSFSLCFFLFSSHSGLSGGLKNCYGSFNCCVLYGVYLMFSLEPSKLSVFGTLAQ